MNRELSEMKEQNSIVIISLVVMSLFTNAAFAEDGNVTVTTVAPPNTTATVELPGWTSPKTVDPGTHHFDVPEADRKSVV